MSNWQIYHNPKCSKSRQTLALLQEKGIEPEVIEYLKNPLNSSEIDGLAKKLGLEPSEFIRKKESVFKDLNLNLDDEAALKAAMSDNPILIERPIVVCGEKAVLGRPPENVLELL